MTFIDVVRKNVAGNFKHYLIYLISMIASVVIYYTFASLQYSEQVRAAVELSQSASTLFTGASGILIFFVAIFVWYSNSFFTRRRKKEVGLYALLGVRKRTIGRMLFLENAAMGAAALAVGIAIGILLSKLFFAIVVRMIGSDVQIEFSVSGAAIGQTALVFLLITLATSLQGYRIVYRFRLAELFQPDHEGQLSPRISVAAAFAAVVLIAVGYGFSMLPFDTSGELARNWGIFLVGIVAGTIFLFRSLIVFLLRLSQRNKKRYYCGVRLVGTAQLLFRVKSNSRLFALIALLSAVTIGMFGSLFGQYYTNAAHAAKAQPFSFTYLSLGEESEREAEAVIESDSKHPLKRKMDIPVLKATGDLYSSFEGKDDPVRVLSASSFNAITEALNLKERVSLEGGEAAFIRPFYTVTDESEYVGRTFALNLDGGRMEAEVTRLLDERVLGWLYPDLVLVVSDERYAEASAQTAPVVYKAFEVEGEKSSKETYLTLKDLLSEDHQLTSYYYTYKSGLEETGLVTFVAAFLGIVFLAATGSVIFFKQMTEAQADKGRYEILRKVGASRKDIRSTIVRQMLFVFGLPLAVGVLHGIVLLNAMTQVVSQLLSVNLWVPIMVAIVAYAAIYAGYCALTIVSYDRTVNRSS